MLHPSHAEPLHLARRLDRERDERRRTHLRAIRPSRIGTPTTPHGGGPGSPRLAGGGLFPSLRARFVR